MHITYEMKEARGVIDTDYFYTGETGLELAKKEIITSQQNRFLKESSYSNTIRHEDSDSWKMITKFHIDIEGKGKDDSFQGECEYA